MFELVLNNYLFSILYLISIFSIKYYTQLATMKKKYLNISLFLLEVGKVKTGMTSQTR